MKRKNMFQIWMNQIFGKRKKEENLIIEKKIEDGTKVIVPGTEKEYEILEREILPQKIICPDCGGITLDGLDYCHKCGGELNS